MRSPIMNLMRVAIIIPVYNEEKYLGEFIQKLRSELTKIHEPLNIVFVDDGSTDTTPYLLKEANIPQCEILSSPQNQGKGASMRLGFQHVKNNSDAIIFMDADLQHNPKHLHRFIEELENHSFVFGYRELSEDAPYIRKLGNHIARFIFRTFFNIERYDLLCGFIAIRKDMYDVLEWKSKDYGVELELAVIIGKRKLPFKEIRIDTVYLDSKKGVNVVDAALILLKIPYWYLIY